MHGKENGSSEAQSSSTKTEANEKIEKIPARIERFDLDSNDTKYDWDLASGLAQYLNTYMTIHVSQADIEEKF